MKTTLICLFFISLNCFGAPNTIKTIAHDRLNNEIVKRVGDIAFKLELQFPDRDSAYYLAYKECGDSEPEEAKDYTEWQTPVGYNIKYYYGGPGIIPYYYKCTEQAKWILKKDKKS